MGKKNNTLIGERGVLQVQKKVTERYDHSKNVVKSLKESYYYVFVF